MVDHSILLDKLKTCGCSRHSIKWFASYLRNRQQFLSIGKEKSSTKELNVWVPQGSILAPLLFSLFINDLPSNVPSASIHMYADDTTVSVSGKSKEEVEAKLIQVLSETSTWIRNKVVLEPLVSPDLAIYIFKQVKVKMTLDLVMSPWSMSNMKLLIVYLWFKFSCNKSESVYEEFEWCH